MSARTLKVTSDDGQIFTLPIDHAADASSLIRSIHAAGGLWNGDIFLPWHRISLVSLVEVTE